MPKRLSQIARVEFQTVRAAQPEQHPGIVLLRDKRDSKRRVATRGGKEQQGILDGHSPSVAANRLFVKSGRAVSNAEV